LSGHRQIHRNGRSCKTAADLANRNDMAYYEICNIKKGFKGVIALDDVSVDIDRAEFHAVIGENGAGKSTLMKILSGVLEPDAGSVSLEGGDLSGLTANKLFQLGISATYQENSLFDNMTVTENLFISELYEHKSFGIDWKEEKNLTRELLNEFGYGNIDPATRISDLSPENRQIVEIIKAAKRDPKIICLDEPTASLTKDGIETLFGFLNKLKTSGVTLIYISHHLEEILRMSDRITVLRDGKKVKTLENKGLKKEDLHALMTGRNIQQLTKAKRVLDKKPILKVTSLSDGRKIHGVDFSVTPGEILGITGLVGSGRSELAWLLYGITPRTGGVIRYKGKDIDKLTQARAKSMGIMYLPEDRQKMGLFLDQNLLLNVTASNISRVTRNGLLDFKKERIEGMALLEQMKVSYAHPTQNVTSLSGGNQQKVMFARCLYSKPDLIILDEPTRGIDVGAKQEIYELIETLAAEGLAVILISSEVEEIVLLSDRVLVIGDGTILDEFRGDAINEDAITRCYLEAE
jgi:ribose transport system ATP-binding protein